MEKQLIRGGVILFRQIVELTINPEDLPQTLSSVSHSDSVTSIEN